jgi:hypothetical protein
MLTVVDKSGELLSKSNQFSPLESGHAAISTPLFRHALLSYLSDTRGGTNPVAQGAGLEVFQMVW